MGMTKPKLGRTTRRPTISAAKAEAPSGSMERSSGLASALFTKTQQRVLGLLFGQPGRALYLSDLISLAGAGSGAVQREVARLVASGLVSVTVRDGRKAYQASERSPIFGELCAIVDKTSGVAEQLRQALAPLASQIDVALLFGSVAKEMDNADSDIDLLVVSDTLILEDLFRVLGPLEERLGRRMSPTLYTSTELAARRRSNNPFVTKVLKGKHRILWGELHEHRST